MAIAFTGYAPHAGLGGVNGLGSGIGPSSSCYDGSYSVGEIHCADFSDVLATALNPFEWGAQITTSCSQQEQSCLIANPSAASATDVCSQNVGISCGTLLTMGFVGLLLVLIVPKIA